MSDESKSEPSDQLGPSPPLGSDKGKAPKKRRLRTALVVIGAIIFVFVIIPKAFHAWHTVSTDDAYVNSHVTLVAPRVSGQVARVLVDDNINVEEKLHFAWWMAKLRDVSFKMLLDLFG